MQTNKQKKECDSQLFLPGERVSSYLIHAGGVQTHNRGVCQPCQNCPQSSVGVQILWLQELFQKSLIKHSGHYIIHNYRKSMRKRSKKKRNIEAGLKTEISHRKKQKESAKVCIMKMILSVNYGFGYEIQTLLTFILDNKMQYDMTFSDYCLLFVHVLCVGDLYNYLFIKETPQNFTTFY